MNLYKVTLSNLAIISQTEQNESALSSLEALKNAAFVRFSQKNVIITVADELKTRALNQISSWTKFWEKVGSLFFSCFGYMTTSQKVESIFEEIKTKKYEVDQEESQTKDSQLKEKENALEQLHLKQDSPKLPTPPQSPDSPPSPCTPDEVRVKREELKNEELRVAAEVAEKKRIADREREAKDFIDPLLPDLLTLSEKEIAGAVKELDEKIVTLEKDKQQACYEYLCGLEHYTLANKIINKIKPENREAFKLRYGLCPEYFELIKSNPEYFAAFNSKDGAALKNLIERDKQPEYFINILNNIILVFFNLDEFSNNKDFDKAIKSLLPIRHVDLRSSILKDVVKAFYNHSQDELDKFIGSLEPSEKDVVYFELAKSKISYRDAQNYALKIENEGLKKKALVFNGLQRVNECKELLNSQSHEIRILISKHSYLRALDQIIIDDLPYSLRNYILRIAAEHYVSTKKWASLEAVINQISFEDVKKAYQVILDKVSVEERAKTEFYLKIDQAFFLEKVITEVDHLDPSLQDDFNAYIACMSAWFNSALTCAKKIKNSARRDDVLAQIGHTEIYKLEVMSDFIKLKALLKKDIHEAEAFVKDAGSPSLTLYFAKRAIRHLIHRDKYDEASKYLEMIPFIDLREDFQNEIETDKNKRADNLDYFKNNLDQKIFFGEYSDALVAVEKEKKLAFKEIGYRLLATQTLDSETAEKAGKLLEVRPENCLINLSGMKELEPFKGLINSKKFSDARALVLSAEINKSWHFTLNLSITCTEVAELIEQKEWDIALAQISTIPYRDVERDYRLKLAKARSQALYPNLAHALVNAGVIADSYLADQLKAGLANNKVDSVFKDVEGVDVSQFINSIFNHYFAKQNYQKALEIAFLSKNYEDYLEKIVFGYLYNAKDEGFDLLKYYPIHQETKFIKQALRAIYFKNEAFREKLISAYPGKLIDLERQFVKIIEASRDITQAQELLKRIKNESCIEEAKLTIAKKFGDFRAYVDAGSFSIGYYLKDFKSALRTSTIKYSIEDLTYIEERLDLLKLEFMSDDILKELYSLLGELYVNYHRTRLQGKVKV